MTPPRNVAVIDIGKTNAKLALVDLETLREIAVVTRPNRVLQGPPWPHFDVEGHWTFLLDALAVFHREHGIDAISVTTHGAALALLDAAGGLAAPVLDYEHNGPDALAAEYDALRPPFSQTGSPRLGQGLNVGAQLHWMFQADPGLRDRTATLVTYPQYWGHRLTGGVATDVTSLGCHTDLWNPGAGAFSTLVDRLQIRDKIAPARQSGDILGTVLPEVAARTGLPVTTPVVCGIHDSNASLYPHVLGRPAPFSVVSTGTWVVVMSVGSRAVTLDPARDALINVNALGQPVNSARFMGGREYEVIRAGQVTGATEADRTEVLADGLMLLPSVEPGSGPFPGRVARWHPAEPDVGSGQRDIALSWYLALMTNVCLDLTGGRGPVLVEGPFARNGDYLDMLAAASAREVIRSEAGTGTSIGAALLLRPVPVAGSAPPPLRRVIAPDLMAYAQKWQGIVTGALSV